MQNECEGDMATTKNIQSIERAFSILELFQNSGTPDLSVKDISESLALNKSTAFGLINTLTNLGYLQQNPENQKYALGLKLLSFSNAVKVQNIIIRAVHPYLEELKQKYGETAHCAVKYNNGVIYVDKVEATGSIYISTQIGTVNDLHCTGVGKCILAYLPEEEQERIYASNLRTMTYHTITNSEQLREEMAKVRQNGYATECEKIAIGVACVAVPIFSGPDTVACAISISGMTARIQMAMERGVVNDLKRISAQISRNAFGYTPPVPPSAMSDF